MVAPKLGAVFADVVGPEIVPCVHRWVCLAGSRINPATDAAPNGERYRHPMVSVRVPMLRSPRVRARLGDVLVAVGVLIAFAVAPPDESSGEALWRWSLAAVLTAGVLLFRRRSPLLVALAVVALWLAAYADDALDDPPFQMIALLLVAYALGAYEPLGRGLVGLAAISVAFVVMNLARGLNTGDSLAGPFQFAVLYGLGYALASGRRSRLGLEEKALQLEREQDERARAAVAEERARMARDLHDSLGHAISVMVLQIGAVRTRLDPRQLAERDTLLTAERAGRESVTELRRMVGVLREAPSGSLAPPVSLSAIDDLIASVRAAGISVDVRREGTTRPVPSGVDITAYRIAQEALTNVVRHAPSAQARLLIAYEPDAIVVEVIDDGAGRPVGDVSVLPGQGLIGMRERVAAYGGTLSAAATVDGGFAVRAHIPLNRDTVA